MTLLGVNGLTALLKARFLGATTVGERGQIVIPAEARREYGLEFGDKVLVFGRHQKMGLLLVKDEIIARYVDETLAELSGLEKLLENRGVDRAARGRSGPGGKGKGRSPSPAAATSDHPD